MERQSQHAFKVDYFNHILIGGDQLTIATIRGCQRVLSNSHSGEERLGRTHTCCGRLAYQDVFMKVRYYIVTLNSLVVN